METLPAISELPIETTRQHIIVQALTARTSAEIAQAVQELKQWLLQHPDDSGIEDAFGVLALRAPATN